MGISLEKPCETSAERLRIILTGETATMKKRVKMLWSGGLDSTAMLIKYLRDGYEVEALYVVVENNDTKVKTELEAIRKLIPIIRERHGDFSFDKIATVHIHRGHEGNMRIKQALIWLFGLLNTELAGFNEVAIGYVIGDVAISYIPDLQRTWQSFNALMINLTDDRIPPLVFPVSKLQKDELKRFYITDEMYSHIVSCEIPTPAGGSCGHCEACKTRARVFGEHVTPYRFEPSMFIGYREMMVEKAISSPEVAVDIDEKGLP